MFGTVLGFLSGGSSPRRFLPRATWSVDLSGDIGMTVGGFVFTGSGLKMGGQSPSSILFGTTHTNLNGDDSKKTRSAVLNLVYVTRSLRLVNCFLKVLGDGPR